MTSSIQGWVTEHGVFFGPLIADGEYWRVITPGFLHFGLLHIALNMYLLYVLGRMLEPELGAVQMLAVYMTSLIAGFARRDDPRAGHAVGRRIGCGLRPDGNGAGRGLVAAATSDALQQIGILVAINLFITFGNSSISKGGHLGGTARRRDLRADSVQARRASRAARRARQAPLDRHDDDRRRWAS